MLTTLSFKRTDVSGVSTALVLASLCALAAPADAIVRRHDVEDAAYRVRAEAYPACIDIIEAGDGIGTLIAPRWLLTAAHVAQVLVQRGQQTIPGPGGPLGIARIVLHPDYRDDTDDIALIQLSDPLPGVTPIPLYAQHDEVGQEVLFMGRGDTGTGVTGERESDRRSRIATNVIVEADRHWISFVFDRPGATGSTALEGISGSGDSGGPAFIRRDGRLFLAGISAFQDEGGHRLGQYGVEEFYVRVSHYLPWIRDVSGRAPAVPGVIDLQPENDASEPGAGEAGAEPDSDPLAEASIDAPHVGAGALSGDDSAMTGCAALVQKQVPTPLHLLGLGLLGLLGRRARR